jgi:hypothetical protein
VKLLAVAAGVMLVTLRCEAQPPAAVPYPKPQPIAGPHGWQSRQFIRRDAPYLQRGLRQRVVAGLAVLTLTACAHSASEPPKPEPQPAIEKPWGVGCTICWRKVKT